MYQGKPLIVLAAFTIGEVYVKMAGRLERASTEVELVAMVREGGSMSAVEDDTVGEKRERSSMKFPAATFVGVRGRWRNTVTS